MEWQSGAVEIAVAFALSCSSSGLHRCTPQSIMYWMALASSRRRSRVLAITLADPKGAELIHAIFNMDSHRCPFNSRKRRAENGSGLSIPYCKRRTRSPLRAMRCSLQLTATLPA